MEKEKMIGIVAGGALFVALRSGEETAAKVAARKAVATYSALSWLEFFGLIDVRSLMK